MTYAYGISDVSWTIRPKYLFTCVCEVMLMHV